MPIPVNVITYASRPLSTQIAITFANADLDFAKQIADMLERISYIDECDTLGRKVDRKDIHKVIYMSRFLSFPFLLSHKQPILIIFRLSYPCTKKYWSFTTLPLIY